MNIGEEYPAITVEPIPESVPVEEPSPQVEPEKVPA